MHSNRTTFGFTLIEVVVALAVITIGLAAVIKATGIVTKNTAQLNERTIAMWVAQNAMAEFELNINGDASKETTGTEEMAGVEWHWQKKIEKTEDPDIRRVEIQVRRNKKSSSQVYATLVSLLPAYFEKENNSGIL